MFNIPNFLTVLRLVMIPCFVYLFYVERSMSAWLFILACLTDIADGYIARKYNLITRVGAFLDPLADKLMQITVLICLTTSKLFPLIALAVILIKELLMIAGSAYMYKKNATVKPSIFGKASTVITAVCVCVIILFGNSIKNYLFIVNILIVFPSLLALAHYWIQFKFIKE